MKRSRIIYANEGIFAGPSFREGISYTDNIYEPNLSKVQSISYSVSLDRQQHTTLGRSSSAYYRTNKAPSVSLDFNYYSASMTNENILGFDVSSVDNCFLRKIMDSGNTEDYRKNFYLVTMEQGIDFVSGDTSKIESVLFFSDCVLNSYGYEVSVGNFPSVSASFVGENMGYYQTGEDLKIPRINKKNRTTELIFVNDDRFIIAELDNLIEPEQLTLSESKEI